MAKRWLEMRMAIPADAVDLISQIMADLGSVGIITAEHELDTFDVPEPGEFGDAPVLKAFFEYPDDPVALEKAVLTSLADLQALLPGFRLPPLECCELADTDWANDWQKHFPPLKVGESLVICPSWEAWDDSNGEIVLTLDPGQAFGTGTHATTRLCLDSLAELFARKQPPRSVLDVGTGSGVLAMAAAALGAVQVMACDIDAEACRVARDNIAQNDLADRVEVTVRPLEQLVGQFDLLLANILAVENIRLGPEFVRHLASGGYLILSGILVEQETQVRAGFANLPVRLVEIRQREEWSCMIYCRHD